MVLNRFAVHQSKIALRWPHAQPTNVTVRTDGRFEVGRLKENFQSGPPLLRDGKPLLMPMKPEQRPGPLRSHHRSGIEQALGLALWTSRTGVIGAGADGLERRSDRIHLARGQCRCLTDFLLTRSVFPVGLPPYRSSLALPRPLAEVFHAFLLPGLLPEPTSLILCPPGAEWPLANPSEEPFCGKAALAGPPAGYWAENRPISRSKTGRAFGS